MANTLGSLVVNLGLNAAEFTTGLTKAEYQTQQFARKMDASFKAIGAFLGTLGIGYAVAAFVKDTISAASALDDLSEATGSSVEALSRLSNQAKVAGVPMEVFSNAIAKLAAGMNGVDDESTKIGKALAQLGISARDPAEAFTQIAITMNRYADGTGKAAALADLFGKNWRTVLPALKAVVEQQEIQATVTAKQAAEAEKLEQALRRMSVESTRLKVALLEDVVPAINSMIERFRLARDAGLGFFAALEIGSTYTDQIGPRLERTRKEVAKLQEQLAYSQRRGFGVDYVLPRLEDAQQRLSALKAIQRQAALLGSGDLSLSGTGDMRDVIANRKPTLDYKSGAAGKDARAGVDEFARAMEKLQKETEVARAELDALVNGTDKLTQAEKAFIALKADDFYKKLTESQRTLIDFASETFIAIEKETEAVKKRNEAYDKHLQSLQDQAANETKARAAIAANVADYESQNDALKRQIAIIGQDDLAHQRLAATLEYEHRKREILKQGVIDLAELQKLDAAYAERLSLLNSVDTANKQLEQTRKNTEFVDALARSFGNAAEEALVMGRTFKDVMAGLEKDLMRVLTRRLVTEPLEAALSSFLSGVGAGSAGAGGAAGGTNWGAILAKLAMSYFGDTTQGGTYGYATGTAYHPGGLAMVHKDEVINLPRGSQVIPANRAEQMMRGGDTFVVNVPAGASRQTIDQTIGQLSRAQMRASRSA